MKKNKYLAWAAIIAISAGMIGASAFADDSTLSASNGNTLSNTSMNRNSDNGTQSKMKPMLGDKKMWMEKSGKPEWKMMNNGNVPAVSPFDKIQGLTDTEKTALKAAFAEHKTAMEAIHTEIQNIDKSTVTPEQKVAFDSKMKSLQDAFLAKIKSITTNADVLAFVQQKGMNQEIKENNKEVRWQMTEQRTQIKDQKAQIQDWKAKIQDLRGQIQLTDAEKAKIDTYYNTFNTKFSDKLSALSSDKLEAINKLIDQYLIKAKATSEIKYQLLALKKLVNDKISASVDSLNIESLIN